MIVGFRFPELLQGPLGRWVRSEIAVRDAPRPDLHQEEHIQHSKPSCNDNEEIADNGLSMIADKRLPLLRGGSVWCAWTGFRRPIGPHGAQGNIDTELHRQLGPHASLPTE
jgi:hypothetical protein